MKSNQRVIVLSRNYSTGLGLVRALGDAGYTVDLIAFVLNHGSSVICAKSKYINKAKEINISDSIEDAENVLVSLMEEYKDLPGSKILFPADDYTAVLADGARRKLDSSFLAPHIIEKDSFIADLMNKNIQTKLAREAGITTVPEWTLSLREEIKIPDNIIYPCFVKPMQSISGQKLEMAVINEADELKSHLLRLQKVNDNRDVLIQEYLNIDTEYDISGLCFGEKIIIPGVIRKTKIASHARGVTMCGVMEPTSILQDEFDKLISLMKKYNYFGMFDLELNKVGEKLYFGEVNLRSGGPNYAYFKSGINLPALFVKELTGEEHDESEEMITDFGKSFAYEKVAWEDYIYGFISKDKMKKCISSADFTLLADESDPVPGKIFNKKIRLSAIKQRLRRALNKK